MDLSMPSEAELSRLFKIRKTYLQMLEDRGYIVNIDDKNQTFDSFKEKFNKKTSMAYLTIKANDKEEDILVDYNDENKLGVSQISSFATKLHNENVKNGILIIKGSLTNMAKQKINEFEGIVNLEYFEEKEFIVNITEHELVPKHYALTESEKKELLKKYRLKDNQLPKILVTDPVARYLGLRKSQVVKIVRPSETAGRYVTYRIAI